MKPGRSLFGHLLAWTLGSLFLVWAAFMYFGYRTGVHESDELTDGHLASVASVLLSQPTAEMHRPSELAAMGGLSELKAHDYQQSLSIVQWNAEGKVLSHSGEAPIPPFRANEGFETVELGEPPVAWRMFSRWNGQDHALKIAVLLNLQERDDLAEDIADQVATPGLWLLPLVALVLTFAIRRGLRPLHELSEQVNQLDVHRDTALKAPPHEEFEAIVRSIDMLIARYNAALARERELASEVAHELRTPLASLRLHADSVAHAISADELAASRRQIEADAARAAAVLTDLLALARASRAELAEAQQSLDLAALSRRVAGEFGQAALDSGHELAVEAPEACFVSGHPVILELALRNLIENALAHTPRGTSVTVRVTDAPAMLEVVDNGETIERSATRAESPRHLGLGLGHQVVRRVADIHGGRFESMSSSSGGERTYRIVFAPPAARDGRRDGPHPT